LDDEEPVMVTGAQFMYMLMSPTLLNQVQARVALPVGRELGTVKLYISGSTEVAVPSVLPATPLMGQPPSMEWMTLKVLLLVGSRS
jgi:hypothetical protein